MVKLSDNQTSIIVALIPAIMGSGVALYVGAYFSELAASPIIKLSLFPSVEDRNIMAGMNDLTLFPSVEDSRTMTGKSELQNSGGGPANNLIASISVPGRVIKYNIMSIENYTADLTNNRWKGDTIKIEIPKLRQGPGTLMKVLYTYDNRGLVANIPPIVYDLVPIGGNSSIEGKVVYDQGSVIGTLVNPFGNPALNAMTDFSFWLIFTPTGLISLGIFFTILSLGTRYIFLRFRKREASTLYKKMTDETTSNLEKTYADYKSQKLKDFEAVLKMESIIIEYQKFVKKIQERSQGVGDDAKLTKLHETYFKAVIDYEIRNYTRNKERNTYIEMFEKAITGAWKAHVQEYKDDVLSNLMLRINNLYRKQFTSEYISS